jgi:hypothetical protein
MSAGMVGQQILDLLIGVRIPGGQPKIFYRSMKFPQRSCDIFSRVTIQSPKGFGVANTGKNSKFMEF